MAFRAKSAERVYAELMSQAARHGILRFTATDNIMDRGYLKTLLPLLVAAELDLSHPPETNWPTASSMATSMGGSPRATSGNFVSWWTPGINAAARPMAVFCATSAAPAFCS